MLCYAKPFNTCQTIRHLTWIWITSRVYCTAIVSLFLTVWRQCDFAWSPQFTPFTLTVNDTYDVVMTWTYFPHYWFFVGVDNPKLWCFIRIAGAWWRHLMKTFPALLAPCEGNPPVTGGFPSQRPVTRSFGVFFDIRLNKWLGKQWGCRWFETQWR